jgi:hypothetical protein
MVCSGIRAAPGERGKENRRHHEGDGEGENQQRQAPPQKSF